MKNKKVKYLLIILVIFVWGTIFYKAVFYLAGTEGSSLKSDFKLKKDSLNKIDTFQILANYPDPFLKRSGTIALKKNGSKDLKLSKQPTKVSVTKDIWPNIMYNGLVHNNKGDKSTVLITINGTGYIMRKGESTASVELISINKDSLKVKYMNSTKYIQRYESK